MNRRKPDWLAVTRTVLIVALAAQGLRVAFASPRLRLQEVRVTGTQRFTPEHVLRLGGIPVGQNIFRVNLVKVAERLQGEPVIQEAILTRELPGTLNVELRERVPAFQIRVAGQQARLEADREGVVFQRAQAPVGKLPLLEIPAKSLPALGQRVPQQWVRTVWECVKLAKKEQLTIRDMRVDEAGELWLNIATFPTSPEARPSLPVIVGRATELPEKFRNIRQVLQGVPDLTVSAQYLNVMCAGKPAYRPLSGKPDEPDAPGETGGTGETQLTAVP
jgi:hypothetical protein